MPAVGSNGASGVLTQNNLDYLKNNLLPYASSYIRQRIGLNQDTTVNQAWAQGYDLTNPIYRVYVSGECLYETQGEYNAAVAAGEVPNSERLLSLESQL